MKSLQQHVSLVSRTNILVSLPPRGRIACSCTNKSHSFCMPPDAKPKVFISSARTAPQQLPIRRRRGTTIVCYVGGAKQYSKEVFSAVRHSKQLAAQHGKMFLGIDYLLLGLLHTPSAVSKLLIGYNVDYDHQLDQIKKAHGISGAPSINELKITDVELAPETKVVLEDAAECAAVHDSSVIGTAHLAITLLDEAQGSLRRTLENRGVDIKDFEAKLMAVYQQAPEQAGQVAPVEEQLKRIKKDFEYMKHEKNEAVYRSSVQDADDIYN